MVLSLSEIINTEGFNEASLQDAFDKFKCSKSPDVENFLKTRALEYEKMNKARTYLMLNDADGEIYAYFTLAINVFKYGETTSKSCKRDTNLGNKRQDAAFLIGQIGKSDSNNNKNILPELLEYIFGRIQIAQNMVGGRIVYLDCKQDQKIVNLYMNNGFLKATDKPDKDDLIQMYRII